MVQLTMRVHIRAEKRREFLQSAGSVMNRLKNTSGCLRCDFYQDYENEDIFCFVQEWKSKPVLHDYLRSSNFGALLGAAKLLSEPAEIKLDITQGNMETVKAIRGKGSN